MNDERKDEIGKLFLLNKETSIEELEKLEIQEIIFLTTSAKHFKENNMFINDNLDIKIEIFSKTLRDKIIKSDELYIVYESNTDYPYIDVNDKVWMFSKKEYADNAKDYYLQQSITLEIKRISKEEMFENFASLHRLGIKKILIDNGEHSIVINRDNILPPIDWNDTPAINIPVENPNLQRSMIKFFQKIYTKKNSEEWEQHLYNLEEEMLRNVITARYLIPMQIKENGASIANVKEDSTLKKGATIEVASLVCNEDDSQVLPVFTDWIEFEKVYDRNMWTGSIATYEDLLELSEKSGGIVINFKGIPLNINENNKKKIEKYMIEKVSQSVQQ